MKLLKLKCPNIKCGKELYCQEEDIAPIRERGYYMICSFCVTRLINTQEDQTVYIQEASKSEMLKMGEVEFDDRHKLSGKKISSIRDRMEEILHDIDNLDAGPEDPSLIKDKEEVNES